MGLEATSPAYGHITLAGRFANLGCPQAGRARAEETGLGQASLR